MPFNDLTIVNIDGRRGELPGSQFALAHSARSLPGARPLLLSPDRPARPLPGITHIPIQTLGYFEYSLFVIFALHRLIETEFVLIVQDDGWVLDGGQWRDEYRDYDYIGAPTQFARVTDASGVRYVHGYDGDWSGLLSDPAKRVELVLNGGFCLRSRRLLQAPSMLGLKYIMPPISELRGPPYEMHWSSNAQFEDVQLCINLREPLERAGIKFAPFHIARQFAFEHLHPVLHDGLDLMEVFGHHSKMRKLTSLDPLTVRYQEGPQFLRNVFGEQLIAQVYQRRGYRIETTP